MGSGKGSQTIGFHYLFSILMGIGRGGIDELRVIKVGDKVAWDGHACSPDAETINAPDLFGGEKKEGGVQGLFRLFRGSPTQVLPGAVTSFVGNSGPVQTGTLPSVKASLGGRMSELRGVTTIWFDGLVCSLNPYPKDWKFRVRRALQGWYGGVAWYPAKGIIYLAEGKVFAMNAAHIIYEAVTNPEWGRGLPIDQIDDNAFTYAANLFCNEGMGLCMTWYRKEGIDAFIQTILDHAGAALYVDRETGLVVLKAIRGDYNINDLPLFTPDSGLLDIDDDDSGSADTQYNEIIVTGHDPITDQDIQMRSHNVAARQAQGAPSSNDHAYPGLATAELCARVAQRDMRINAAGLKKLNLRLDRRAWRLSPASVFRISHPARDIENMVVRAGEIDDGNMLAGEIKIKAMQDVFSLPATSFVNPVESGWTPPDTVPVPPLAEWFYEVPYRDVYRALSAADLAALTPDDSYIQADAAAPSSSIYLFDLLTKADGDPDGYVNAGTFSMTPYATVTHPVAPTDTAILISRISNQSDDMVGDSVRIANETMRVVSYTEETGVMVVVRGCDDTWPTSHEIGFGVWFPDDETATDGRQYSEGELVYGKLLSRTSSAVLENGIAHTLILEGRQGRPYPPADVQVNGISIFGAVGVQANPEISWVERNRITQLDQLIGFFDVGVTAEAGTTYTARTYDADGITLRGTYDNIASPWTYTSAMQTADGILGVSLRIELVAVRDGIESWRPQQFQIAITGGYGYGYGFNYGGA